MISLFVYDSSSYGIDMSNISISFVVFALGSMLLLKSDLQKKDYLSFDIIFLFSFFLVSYCAILFVLGSEEELNMIALRFVDTSYATQASALCSIAICCYLIGANRKTKAVPSLKANNYIYRGEICLSVLYILSVSSLTASTLLFVIQNGIDSIAVTDRPFLQDFYKVFLILLLVVRAHYSKSSVGLRAMYSQNKLVFFTAIPIAALYLYIGDRGVGLTTVFIFVAVYALYYGKIRPMLLLTFIIVGAFAMFVIRSTRLTGASLKHSDATVFMKEVANISQNTNALTLFADLYGASQELYLEYEYKQKYGLYYPEQIILIPFSPLPAVPTAISRSMFGMTPSELSPGEEIDRYITTDTYESSFGDHIVTNLYMRWGLVGVILGFLLFGRVVSYFKQNRRMTIQCAACYVYLISTALYLPRSSMLDIIRPIAYIFFFTYFAHYLGSRKIA